MTERVDVRDLVVRGLASLDNVSLRADGLDVDKKSGVELGAGLVLQNRDMLLMML
jgi:hypothetical protein